MIVDTDVSASAAIAWNKLNKTGASLADLPTRSAADLNSGTLPAARLPAISGDITMAAGTSSAAITAGVIVNADVNANAAIAFSKINSADSIMDSDISSEAYIDMKKIGTGQVDNTKLGYLSTVTSNIQTQLNNKASLVTTPQQTTADITYYVRTDGNDGNTGLANTAGGAFKTIGKAVSMIPKIVNHAVVINVGVGTYPEQVIIAGFSGSGYITVSGDAAASTSRSVNIFTVYRNPIQITVKGFNITSTTTTALYVEGCANVILQYLNIVGAATGQLGIQVHSSKVFINASVISNRTAAMQAVINGEIISDSNSGTGNYDAANAGSGGKVTLTGSKPAGINETSAGGTIFVGGGVINPWGDNTMNSRSTVGAFQTTGQLQSLSAGVTTKVLFPGLNYDHLGEFVSSRFTAKKLGIYLITTTIAFPNPAINNPVNVSVYLNNVDTGQLYNGTQLTGATGVVNGAIQLKLAAGDYVEIFAISTQAATLGASSLFAITQIA